MQFSKVIGKRNEQKVILFTLSTCAWCKLLKQFLKDNDVEYSFIDIDLCQEEEKEKIRQMIRDKGGLLSFPTTIIDDKILITGFRKDKIKEALNF
ncbi:MAG: glutaredoxin family protein [Candidatus Bathyarchaeota archaeon]|nr:glutaredoxin family protein [Candidatus Bathyarchaeota archaeon]